MKLLAAVGLIAACTDALPSARIAYMPAAYVPMRNMGGQSSLSLASACFKGSLAASLKHRVHHRGGALLRMTGGDAGENASHDLSIPPPPPADLAPVTSSVTVVSTEQKPEAGKPTTTATAALVDEDDDDDDDDSGEGTMANHQVAILAVCVAVVASAAVALFLQVPLEDIQTMSRQVPKFAQGVPVAIALYVLVDYFSALALGWARNNGLDMTMASFVRGTVKYGISIVALISILGTLGVQTNGLTAAVTSIGLSVGLASQKVLGNLAAGLMLLILRPFKTGDFVILGGKATGVVNQISIFATQVDSIGNVRISVPNSEVYGTVVENYSKHRMRLVEIEVCTAPSGGVAEARKVIESAIMPYSKFQDEEMMLRRIIKRRMGGSGGKAKAVTSSASGAAQTTQLRQRSSGAAQTTQLSPSEVAGGKAGAPAAVPRGVFDEFKALLQWQKSGNTIDFTDLGLDPQGKVPPKVWMKTMTQQGYNWLIRVWVPGSQFESLKFSMTEDVAAALRKARIRTNADVLELKFMPKHELPPGSHANP